jgi:hypothetical protein
MAICRNSAEQNRTIQELSVIYKQSERGFGDRLSRPVCKAVNVTVAGLAVATSKCCCYPLQLSQQNVAEAN